MTNTVTISCIINTTDPLSTLGFEAWVDDKKFVDIDHVTGEQPISMEILDDVGEHTLKFVLKNKTDAHTQIDESGAIISDATLTLSDLAFDEIKLGYMTTNLAVYSHDFNGNGDLTEEKFHNVMGCNGTVTLNFSTPLYLWLLEHM